MINDRSLLFAQSVTRTNRARQAVRQMPGTLSTNLNLNGSSVLSLMLFRILCRGNPEPTSTVQCCFGVT